jgi:hypothetical protein
LDSSRKENTMGVKGSWQRPGEGYEDGHSRIWGEKPKKEQYVPPPLPGQQPKDDAKKED